MDNEEITWREFELLVAHIESQLSPKGATVKSPDKILDKVSGSLREVDASIRYMVGSTPILITVECRNRGKIQDDLWIEQLSKKKEKIGASATIAVSKNGFTKPAQKTAKHYGIELRTLREIEDSANIDWLNNITLNVDLLFWKYVSIQVGLDTETQNVIIDPMVDSKILELGCDAYIAKNDETGEKMYLGDIGSKFIDEGTFPKIAGIEPFGRISSQNPLYISTSEGQSKIKYVDIRIRIVSINKPVSVMKTFEYSSSKGPIVQLAEFKYQFNGGSFKIGVMHKDSPN